MVESKLVIVDEPTAKKLTSSIVEVEAYKSLYEKSVLQHNYPPQAFKNLLNSYMDALIQHKALWKEILIKFVGEDEASLYRDLYKFDIYKKAIFLDQEALNNATTNG